MAPLGADSIQASSKLPTEGAIYNDPANPWWQFNFGARHLLLLAAFVSFAWLAGQQQRTDHSAYLATASKVLQQTDNVKDNWTQKLMANGQRPRPALPTLIISPPSDEPGLQNSLLASMTDVFSKFDTLALSRAESQPSKTKYWPEEYEFFLMSFELQEHTLITSQLVQLASGRIVHTKSMKLPTSVGNSLAQSEIKQVEEFAARLVQSDGALMRDYRNQKNHSITMNCVLRLTNPATNASITTAVNNSDVINDSKAIDSCIDNVAVATSDHAMTAHLRASLLLQKARNATGKQRENLLNAATKKANGALKIAPQIASLHTTLMQALYMQGRTSDALKHGKLSLSLNAYDADTLRAVARVMEDLTLHEESDELRVRASRITGEHTQYASRTAVF